MAIIATWGQQPGESDPAFEAFKVYRDQGAKRSLRSTGRALGKSSTLMDRWSSRWSWVARAAAWDQEQAELRKEARFQAVAEAEERHGKLARAVLGRVAAELGKNGRAACQTCGRGPVALTAAQVGAWLRAGVEVERLALGLGGTGGPQVAVQVNAGGHGPATGATALVLLRDERTQELATDLLGRMRSLDPSTSTPAGLPGPAGGNGNGGDPPGVVTVEAIASRAAAKAAAVEEAGGELNGHARRELAATAAAELAAAADQAEADPPRHVLPLDDDPEEADDLGDADADLF